MQPSFHLDFLFFLEASSAVSSMASLARPPRLLAAISCFESLLAPSLPPLPPRRRHTVQWSLLARRSFLPWMASPTDANKKPNEGSLSLFTSRFSPPFPAQSAVRSSAVRPSEGEVKPVMTVICSAAIRQLGKSAAFHARFLCRKSRPLRPTNEREGREGGR